MVNPVRFERLFLYVVEVPLTLRVINETEGFVRGYEVDPVTGEDITRDGLFSHRLHVIGKDLIVSREALTFAPKAMTA